MGGPAGDMSIGVGDKGVGLLLVTFLCKASLGSGKESEVRYGIWPQHGHLRLCDLDNSLFQVFLPGKRKLD